METFGTEYLRTPTAQEIERLLRVNAARGFPGCVGSLDVYAHKLYKCPKAFQAQNKDIFFNHDFNQKTSNI